MAALLIAAFTVASAATAQPNTKPKLPPGRDPGGIMIGLVTTGLDPSQPGIAQCLARDGEGELIGWDVVDRDRAPFRRAAPSQPGDENLFSDLPCGRIRIVPARTDPADPVSIAKALSFLSTTPARLIVVPASSQPQDMTTFWQAAAAFPQLLIILAEPKALPEKPPANVAPVAPSGLMRQAVRLVLCGDQTPSKSTDPACR